MLEDIRHNAKAWKHGKCNLQDRNEVGRIVLGERLFLVMPASAMADRPECEEACRFDVDGIALAVVEVKDRCRANAADAAGDLAGRLTGRELEIAVLVAQGHGTKNIAFRLGISEWTVATYLRRIFTKLNVDSRAAMVYRCAPLINASLAFAVHGRNVESSPSS